MRSDKLASILGDIDDKYILETMPQKKKKTNIYLLISAAAASFLIVAGSSCYFRIKPDNNSFGNTAEVYETENTSAQTLKVQSVAETTLCVNTDAALDKPVSETTASFHSDEPVTDRVLHSEAQVTETISDLTTPESEPVTEIIPDTVTSAVILETEPEPVPVPYPSPDDSSLPDRVPVPSVFPVNREDNSYDKATMNGQIYYKKGAYVFSSSKLKYDKLSAFIEDEKNQSGVREFVKTIDGISADDLLLVKCGETEGKYFTFFNEKLSEEEINEILEKII